MTQDAWKGAVRSFWVWLFIGSVTYGDWGTWQHCPCTTPAWRCS